MRGRQRKLLPLLAIMLAALACDTVSNEFVQKVGTTALFITDADLDHQNLDAADPTLQVAEWELTQADLLIGGDTTGDMLFGEDEICVFTDTSVVSPIPEGRCSSGMVIGATTEETPVEVMLTLTFTMSVRRGTAKDYLAPGEFERPDQDGDEWINEVDNCPWIPNQDQEDDDSDGIGEACTYVDAQTGYRQLDSDGDGWPDVYDNCVWNPNPDQADTQGVGADGIADGIGDACAEQTAAVELNGSREIVIALGPIDLIQLQYSVTYLTVDFESDQSLEGCWDDGACALSASAIKMCVNNSLSTAAYGCP
jgi:hypothetical protein